MMHIDMTESELISKLNSLQTPRNVVGWLLDLGISIKEDNIEPGVYRRTRGMDMAEWDGRRWRGFNIETEELDFTMGSSWGEWTLVLDTAFRPVCDGLTVVLDDAGKRVG